MTTETSMTLPFDPQRTALYSREELWDGYDSVPANNKSLDWKIFLYFNGATKYAPAREELAAQRLHDSHIETCLNDFFAVDETAATTAHKVVMIVGSHSSYRDDPAYADTVRLTCVLKRAGYFVVSGGGPGLMEACHLGTWMSIHDDADVEAAIATMATTSKPPVGSHLKQYEMPDYWQKSLAVIGQYPHGGESVGIPTWFYGHEGANAFSTHVGKYFSNALREEKICALGISGVIYLNGGPGTAQEAFVDAAENGYASYNWYSPMLFYRPQALSIAAMNLITDMLSTKNYGKLGMIGQAQTPGEAIDFLHAHPPVNANPPTAPLAHPLFRRAE